MNPSKYYPWHQFFWDQLSSTRASKNLLPQVMLFSGPSGLGKRELAQQVIALYVCEKRGEQGYPCEVCRGCGLLKANTHPDVQYLLSGPDNSIIKIDAIRNLIEWSNMQPHYKTGRFAIVAAAEAMHISAVNALLKTVESPASQTCFILISDRPAMVPATLKSRCQIIRFRPSYSQETIDWISKASNKNSVETQQALFNMNGSPLKALDYLVDTSKPQLAFVEALHALALGQQTPLAIAAQYHRTLEASVWLRLVMQWTLQKSKIEKCKTIQFSQQLFNAWDQWVKLHKTILQGTKLNNQLVMEKVLIDLQTSFLSSS